jgi:hypothetical protein
MTRNEIELRQTQQPQQGLSGLFFIDTRTQMFRHRL